MSKGKGYNAYAQQIGSSKWSDKQKGQAPSKQDKIKDLVAKQQKKHKLDEQTSNKTSVDPQATTKASDDHQLKEWQLKYSKLEKKYAKQAEKINQVKNDKRNNERNVDRINAKHYKEVKSLRNTIKKSNAKETELQAMVADQADEILKLKAKLATLSDTSKELVSLREFHDKNESVIDTLKLYRDNPKKTQQPKALQEYRPIRLTSDDMGDYYVKWIDRLYHYLHKMELHYQVNAITLFDTNPKLPKLSKKTAKALAQLPVAKPAPKPSQVKAHKQMTKLENTVIDYKGRLKAERKKVADLSVENQSLRERLVAKHESDAYIALDTYDTTTLVQELLDRMTLDNITEFELMDDVVLKYRALFINHVKGNSAQLVKNQVSGDYNLRKANKKQMYPELFGYFWKADDGSWVFNDLEDNLYTQLVTGNRIEPELGFIYRVGISPADKVLVLKKYKAISKHEMTTSVNNHHKSRKLKKVQHDEDLGIYNPYADTNLTKEYLTEKLAGKKILLVSWHRIYSQRDNLERYGAKVTTLDSSEESEVYLASQINSSQYDLVMVDINGINHGLSKLLSFRLFSDEDNNIKLVNHINKDDAVIIASQYFNTSHSKLNLLDLEALRNQSSKEY